MNLKGAWLISLQLCGTFPRLQVKDLRNTGASVVSIPYTACVARAAYPQFPVLYDRWLLLVTILYANKGIASPSVLARCEHPS